MNDNQSFMYEANDVYSGGIIQLTTIVNYNYKVWKIKIIKKYIRQLWG